MTTKQFVIKFPEIKSISKQQPKIYPKEEFVLYFDGCSKGNPGPSGIGAVIYKDGIEYWSSCKYIGNKRTNNEAEYSALILGLETAIEKEIKKISVCGDSLLVINQVNGIYKVKNKNLFELYNRVDKLKKAFNYIDFNHVYRNENKRADQLSNLALELVDDISSETSIIDDIFEEEKNFEDNL